MKVKIPTEDGFVSVYDYDDGGQLINHEIIKEDKDSFQSFELKEDDAILIAKSLYASNPVKYGKLEAFTRSSSFVGNVRYDTASQEMTMILAGVRYSFCGVSQLRFDSLQGSGSVGKAFNDIIKGQHDC